VSRNRIASLLSSIPAPFSFPSSGFMACPAVLLQAGSEEQQAFRRRIHRWALEQAAAVMQPSLLERFGRDLLN